MDFLNVERVESDPVKKKKIEIVERKGIGHPDSISDGIAEAVSRALCKEYMERFGRILHHNTDEVQLVAGKSNPAFSGGETVEPIFILLAGRATKNHDGEEIPVDNIALDAARNYIENNFKKLDPRHIEFESRIGETSTDLKSVFNSEGTALANDTSFGVGHAPLSPVEKTVRTLENELHGEIDAVGEDVKVMGLRKDSEFRLTVAAAVIAEEVSNRQDYADVVEHVKQKARTHAEKLTDLDVRVKVNTADTESDSGIYLTETGTSAEMGDDGSVGRGNRVNGLITPRRPMSLEAASGKNPVTHVGKIYNLLADQIAREIHEENGGFASVKILSRIGSPIDQPQAVDVEARGDVEEIVARNLSDIDVSDRLVRGELKTF